MPRPRKTKEAKKAEGTYRSDRDSIAPNFPSLKELPKPPADLDRKEAELFTEICQGLLDINALARVDVFTIVAYVKEATIYNKAVEEILNAPTIITEKGAELPSPHCKIKDSASAAMSRLARDLGLTPRARALLSTYFNEAEPEEKDPLGDLLS